MSSAVVLIADHDPMQRQLIDLLLAEDGHQVVAVESGREALEFVREHTPDIAILDLKLYDMSGADVCEKMKSVTRLASVPVILTTPPQAGVDLDARTKSLAYFVGANLVLQKPLGDKNLRQRVRDLMAQEDGSTPGAEATETTLVIEEAIRAIDKKPVPEQGDFPGEVPHDEAPHAKAPHAKAPHDEPRKPRADRAPADPRPATPGQEFVDGDNGNVGRGGRLPQHIRNELKELRAKVAEQARVIESLEKRNALLLAALDEAKGKPDDSRGLFGRRRSNP